MCAGIGKLESSQVVKIRECRSTKGAETSNMRLRCQTRLRIAKATISPAACRLKILHYNLAPCPDAESSDSPFLTQLCRHQPRQRLIKQPWTSIPLMSSFGTMEKAGLRGLVGNDRTVPTMSNYRSGTQKTLGVGIVMRVPIDRSVLNAAAIEEIIVGLWCVLLASSDYADAVLERLRSYRGAVIGMYGEVYMYLC